MTVVTHAPVIAAALVENEGVRLVTLGGQVDRQVGAALGGGVLAAVEAIRPDLLLLGACGIDADAGITAHSLDDAAVKRAVAARAGRVAVAADPASSDRGALLGHGPRGLRRPLPRGGHPCRGARAVRGARAGIIDVET